MGLTQVDGLTATDNITGGNISGSTITGSPISGSSGSFTTVSAATAIFTGDVTVSGKVTVGQAVSAASLHINAAISAATLNATGNVKFDAGQISFVSACVADGNFTMTVNDYCFVINHTSAQASSVFLPAAPTKGQEFIVKDGKGDAGTRNITVDVVTSALTIDGNGTSVIGTNFQSKKFIFNGTQYNVI